jgi:hypothetical protein
MALRTISISSTAPTRAEAWTLFNEAWGYFTGSILLSELTLNNRFLESQIQFLRQGHTHSGSFGLGLPIAAFRKANFDLNGCLACWIEYWNDAPDRVWALLTGAGSIACTSASGAYFTGSVLLDFDPVAASAPDAACKLDLRAMNTFAFSNPTVHWIYYAAWASPTEPAGSAEINFSVINLRTMAGDGPGTEQVGPGCTTPKILALAATSLATLTFDYYVLVYRAPV